jgi:hypothetical protein
MHHDELRKIITDQFYTSLKASGVEVNAIPSGQLHALVEALADGFIAGLGAVEQEGDMPPITPGAANQPPTPNNPGGGTPLAGNNVEVKVWEGRPYLSIGVRYELTGQRLRVYRGILGNRIEEIELIRVKDTNATQNLGERMLNIGDIYVVSADPTTPRLVLRNVHDPVAVRELLRKTVMEEKQRRGLYYREDIGEENP